MKTIETSKGPVLLRDIKLKDNKLARSYAGRLGGFNEQDYYTKLYELVCDKDEKFLNELSAQDENNIIEALRSLILDTNVGDAKKQ